MNLRFVLTFIHIAIILKHIFNIIVAGAVDRLGWAFGLGLDRLAMILHSIPDIRILWSQDPGVLVQFQNKSVEDKIVYKVFINLIIACSLNI